MNTATETATAPVHVDQQLIGMLAAEIHAPIEMVRRVFEEEFRALHENARITQFLQVLATHRVRTRLRKH